MVLGSLRCGKISPDSCDTKLYAPFDGYIQNVNIERYQEVKASYPIVSFIDLSQIKIEAYIPEDMAVNARKISADACNIIFNNLKGKTFVPEKTFVTQSATDNNISYLFTAIINNSDNSLLGGMAGSLSIPTPSSSSSLHQSVAIPQTAVCHTNEKFSKIFPDQQGLKLADANIDVGWRHIRI